VSELELLRQDLTGKELDDDAFDKIVNAVVRGAKPFVEATLIYAEDTWPSDKFVESAKLWLIDMEQ